MTWPLPYEAIRKFTEGNQRTVVVEEGEKVMAEKILAYGIQVERACWKAAPAQMMPRSDFSGPKT